MEELLEILHELNEDADFEHSESLVEEGLLTSLEMVMLVSEINARMGVSLPPEAIVPENFKTVQTIYDLILRCEED